MLSSLFDRWPLRRQIVLVAGGAIVLFGLGAAEFVRQNEMRAFERTFGEQTSKLVGTLAAASLDAVLSADRPVLDTVIQSLVGEDPEVEAVAVFDDRGDSITSWQRDPDAPLGRQCCMRFERDVTLEGDVYGRFEVLWNVSRRRAEIREYATRIYLYAAGISAVLALLVLVIAETLIVRPVRAIHERLRALDGGVELAPLEFASSRELRDIGATVDSIGDVLSLRRRKEAELEAVSRQKSEFLANMSHELRTPMNGVLGMLSLVADTPLNASQADQVRIATASGRSLLRLINDILDFSKVEAGKLEFESIAFDLEALVDEGAEVLAEQAHAKGLALSVHVDARVPVAVRGDPTRLGQVLTNLAGNAIKFTAHGRVDIVAGPADAHGPARPGSLRFEVIDTGVGIAADALASVFESFAQADGSTTRNYGGTGLGLAISRQLIEGMGGAIGVTSEPGRGSRFWFELELPADGADAIDVAARARASLVGAGARRLIVASSDAAVRERLGGLCDELGTGARIAGDAASLLAALRRDDAVASGGDGAEAAEAAEAVRTVVFDVRASDLPGPLLVRLIEADPAFDDVRLVPLRAIADAGDGLDPDACPRIERVLNHPVTRASMVRLLVGGEGVGPSRAERDEAERRRRARFAALGVLVVEDNPVNQEVALGMLAKLGVRAELAGNGEEALERLARERFDAVLMDCQMPVMDGYAATRALREREAAEASARLPVIALTANAMQGDAERCLAAGMDDYLAKPFDPDRLEEKLMLWLPAPDGAGDDAAGRDDADGIDAASADGDAPRARAA